MSGKVQWVEVPPEDSRPIHGPPCPGVNTHQWHLAIEEGQMALWSGCETCDDAVVGWIGGQDVFMDPIDGTLEIHHEVIGYETPEHDVWWEFLPNE